MCVIVIIFSGEGKVVDGKVCGENLPIKVKFSLECEWTVNPYIFQKLVPPPDSDVYICDGMGEEDQVCGRKLSPDMIYCPQCATRRKRLILPPSTLALFLCF